MSEARITTNKEWQKHVEKKVVDVSRIDMLTSNDRVNEVELSKHVDTNATIS
jgi:hypothetical protein